MDFLWTLRDLKRAVGARTHGADFDITGVSIDSRTVKKGDVFIALHNEQDGHDYVQSAYAAGAVAAVVDHAMPSNIEQIEVEDTFQALWDMGRAQRDWSRARRIAITGSCGKTSTKELMAKGLNAHHSIGSYNNHWGVPLSLARMDRDVEYGVFEVGMSNPGEIKPLSELVQPEIAVVTNIAPAHIGAFGDIKGIAAEKLSIAEGLKEGGKLVTSFEVYEAYPDLFTEKPVTYSLETADPADVVLEGRSESASGQTIVALVFGKQVSYHLPLVGEHHAMNSLCVMAVAHLLGESLEKVALRLEAAEAVAGRGKIHEVSGVRVIDESYNANPKSMNQALQNLVNMKHAHRKIAIVGDMLELGEESEDYHTRLATKCVSFDTVICVGEHMRHLFDALPKEMDKYHFDTPKDINIQKLCTQLEVGDTVMVKGSNGIFWKYDFVPRLVEAVEKHAQEILHT